MFSMGQNFLNSPGAQLLGMLGVHLPGAQPQAPAPQAGTPQSGGALAPSAQDFGPQSYAPIPNMSYQAPPLDMQAPPEIPKPPHGGLFSRVASALMGGG